MEPFPMPTAKKKASTTATEMDSSADDSSARADQRAAQIKAILDELGQSKRVAPTAYEKWQD